MRRTGGYVRWGRLPLWSLVAVLLWGLLPLPGFAQAPVSSPPEDPYGGYEDDEPQEDAPQGEIIPHESSSSGSSRGGARLISEALFGLAAGFVGLAPGAYLGFVVAASEDSSGSGDIFGVFGLGFVGVTLGAALGVTGGGHLLGGEGRFLATLGGAALGALAGGLLAIPAAFVVDVGWIVPILTLPVIGASIGYESSHTREQERKAAVAGTRLEMVPVVSVRPSGGIVAGLAGRF